MIVNSRSWIFFKSCLLLEPCNKTIVLHYSFERKNLSIQSPRDFESGLDTIDPNWFYLDKYFCRNTSSLGAIYDSFKSKVLKMVQMKNNRNFTYKKPAATSAFCKRNFSPMHHIDFIHTLCQCSFLYLELGLHALDAV